MIVQSPAFRPATPLGQERQKGWKGRQSLETSDREGRDARRIPAGHHRRAAAEEKRIISVPKKAEEVQIAPCTVNKKIHRTPTLKNSNVAARHVAP